MFSLLKPSEIDLRRALDTASTLPASYSENLNTRGGPEGVVVPAGYDLDHSRTQIGHGIAAFQAAVAAFRRWSHFDVGWVRIANAEAPIEPGQPVAMEAHTLGFWIVGISRILYVVDLPTRFEFAYATTALHAERGEERFQLEFFPETGAVFYDLLAVSQPVHPLARLAYPYSRSQQHRFARDSHQRMRAIVSDSA